MSLEGFAPTVLDRFGGLCTNADRISLRLGLSPNCRNVRFAPGMVGTRDGYNVAMADNIEPLCGVSQLVRANGDRHIVALSTNGTLKAEFPSGTLTLLESAVSYQAFLKTAEVFSTQYLAFSDGKLGKAPMRRYDGAVIGAVGIGAPGAKPTAADNAAAATGTGLLAGDHYVVVVFINKFGDWSGVSPIEVFTSAGGKKTDVTIPLGPPDTAQRVVGISPVADPGHFLYTDKLVVGENVTATAITFDIDESELVNSQASLNRYISGFVPWMPAGCASYQERLIVWGARATLQPALVVDLESSPIIIRHDGLWNLAFDGGFAAGIPNGWTAVGAGQAEGGAGTTLAGRCFRIDGDAVSGARGEITQENRNNSRYVGATGRYGVAILFRSSANAVGKLNVELNGGPSGGPWTTLLTTSITLPSTPQSAWVLGTAEMGVLVGAQHEYLQMRVWASDGPMGAGEWVDCVLALYDANDNQFHHTLYASDTGKPGTFIGETCSVSIGPDDGEGIRNVFRIRNALFVAKERALYAITNTNVGEPVTWGADITDAYGGTPSLHGVANGNGYVVIVGRDGLRYFDGGVPRLVSRQIEPTWSAADWSHGERAIAIVDPLKEIVRVALPATTDSQGCSIMLVCDFKGGWTDGSYDGGGMRWSLDRFDDFTKFLAGTLALSGGGIHIPVFSAVGDTVTNDVADSREFSTGWTFPDESPTITAGVADGRTGNNATRWAFTGNARRAVVVLPAATNGRTKPTISFRIKPPANMTVSVALDGAAPTQTFVAPANLWTRIAAAFYDGTITTGNDITITLTATGAPVTSTVDIADLQVAYYTERADLGFVDTGAGQSGAQQCALLVYPTTGSRRDFSGRIRTLYETGMFGQTVGRSTYDRCLVRAVGLGTLDARYAGMNARTWVMTGVALSPATEEDLEYGGDMKGSLASVVLENASEDGWFTLRSLAVMSSPLGVGWARGRN